MDGGACGGTATLQRMDGNEHIDARGRALVYVLSNVLDKLVTANNGLSQENTIITKFHAQRPPGIGIHDYLIRVFKYTNCSPECLVLSLVYIDRLIDKNNFTLSSLNVHRIIITSVMLSAKYFDDQYFNNAFYAKVGGVPCSEMNLLELDFLFMINFSLHVTQDAFIDYYNHLASHYIFSTTLYSEMDITLDDHLKHHYIQPDPHRNNQLVYYTRTNKKVSSEDQDQDEEEEEASTNKTTQIQTQCHLQRPPQYHQQQQPQCHPYYQQQQTMKMSLKHCNR